MAELAQVTYLNSLLNQSKEIQKRNQALDFAKKRKEKITTAQESKLEKIVPTAIKPRVQGVTESGIRPQAKYGNIRELATKASTYKPYTVAGTTQPFSQFNTEKTYTTSQDTAATDLYNYCVNNGAGCTTAATTYPNRVYDFAARRQSIQNKLAEVNTLINPYITSINNTYYTGGSLNVKPDWLSVADWQTWQNAYSAMEALKTARRNNQDNYIKTGNSTYYSQFVQLNEQMKGYLTTMNNLISPTVTTAGQNVSQINTLQNTTKAALDQMVISGATPRTKNTRTLQPDIQNIASSLSIKRNNMLEDLTTVKKKSPVFIARPA